MQIKTNGKILETRPLVNLFIEGEAHADKVTILLPQKYDTLDLSLLTYILAGASEKDTRVEQTLTKATTADAVSLSWDVDSSWTAVSGKLTLELLGQDAAGNVKIKFAGETPLLVKQALPAGVMARPDVAQQYLSEVRTLAAETSNNAAAAAGNATTAAADAVQTAADRTASGASATAAQSSAAAAKADADRAHAVAGFDGTFNSLSGKPTEYPPNAHSHAISDVTDLTTQLSKKANRKNMFQNWYFGNPVNQLGKTEYTAAGRTVDRWLADPNNGGIKVLIENGFIRVKSTSIGTGTSSQSIRQSIENPQRFNGKTITVSALYKGTGTSLIIVTADGAQVGSKSFTPCGNWSIVEYTITLPQNITTLYFWFYADISSSLGYTDFRAVKLEEGAGQSLATQDTNGDWLLNDPPGEYGEELARCQRHFLRLQYSDKETIGNACYGTTWLNLQLGLPVEMRISAPTITMSCAPKRAVDGFALTTHSNTKCRGGNANIGYAITGTAGASYVYADMAGYIDFDAEIY